MVALSRNTTPAKAGVQMLRNYRGSSTFAQLDPGLRRGGAEGFVKIPFSGSIGECRSRPFNEGGNPSGWWSRRISHEHRLVYRVAGSGDEQVLQVAQCRYHY